MIREVGMSFGRSVLDGVGRLLGRIQEHRSMSADLLESDDAYLAVFDAPGAEAPDITVRFKNDVLFVHVDRFREFHDGYEMVFPGRGLSLDGSVALSPDVSVDADRAEATVTRNGTLEVLIPKTKFDGEETDEGEGTSIPTDEHDDAPDGSEETTPDAV